jgi:hypothetical protein
VLLAAVERAAGDGYLPTESLFYELSGRSRRDVAAAISRAVRDGYLDARRGPEGRRYVAISSEGWALLRAEPDQQ